MKNKALNIREVNIQYNDEKDSRNKLIKFLIDFLMESNVIDGDNHGK